MSSSFLPVKMSMAVKLHLAWPCLPVLDVDTSTTCRVSQLLYTLIRWLSALDDSKHGSLLRLSTSQKSLPKHDAATAVHEPCVCQVSPNACTMPKNLFMSADAGCEDSSCASWS